jgi:hypothetical protein
MNLEAYRTIEGTPGLDLSEVGYVFSPGRGRDQSGEGLDPRTVARARFAGQLFIDLQLRTSQGLLIASGYKTPKDKAGRAWSVENAFNPAEEDEPFIGIPEADLTAELWMHEFGISDDSIRRERHSIDTVTNFVHAENKGHFPDDRPVAIIAQEAHLQRMIDIIAPKTLKREYIGVIVPEEVGRTDQDTLSAQLESRAVLLGIKPNSRNIVKRTDNRAQLIWGGVLLLQNATGLINR